LNLLEKARLGRLGLIEVDIAVARRVGSSLAIFCLWDSVRVLAIGVRHPSTLLTQPEKKVESAQSEGGVVSVYIRDADVEKRLDQSATDRLIQQIGLSAWTLIRSIASPGLEKHSRHQDTCPIGQNKRLLLQSRDVRRLVSKADSVHWSAGN
jgi:hypothetical protein